MSSTRGTEAMQTPGIEHWSETDTEAHRWLQETLDHSRSTKVFLTAGELCDLASPPRFYRDHCERMFRTGFESGFDEAIEVMWRLYAELGFVRMREIVSIMWRWSDTVLKRWRNNDAFSGTGHFTRYHEYDDPVDVTFRHESWQAIRQRIIQRDGECIACGRVDGLEVDHIDEVQDGGLPIDGNLQTLCAVCHQQKTSKRQRRKNQ